MTAIRFCVPVPHRPPGVNVAYAPGRWGKRHGFIKTPVANEYADRIKLAARRAMRGKPPIEGRCLARLLFVHPDERADTDGPVKLTLDALEGIVYRNDRQARRLEVDYLVDPEAPRVEIEIVEVSP